MVFAYPIGESIRIKDTFLARGSRSHSRKTPLPLIEKGSPEHNFAPLFRIESSVFRKREQPGVRLSDASEAAGFTSESAFYRNFKTLTGQTPAEWLAEVQDNH